MLKNSLLWIFRSSLLWGGLMSFVFYSLIHYGIIKNETVVRYTAMHPVEYSITAMFFVGLAGLIIKFVDIRTQWSAVRVDDLFGDNNSARRLDVAVVPRLQERVRHFEKERGVSLSTNRIFKLLSNIRHAGTAEKLDDDFRLLAEDDYLRAESDYGLTKMIIWAIPILGFLGTVIGIALAMGNLSPEALEESLPKVMEGLTVAFDTTALALALSMIIYFSQFLIWRDEQRLLDEVNEQAEWALKGRFETVGSRSETGHLTAIRKMIEVVIESVEQLVTQQAGIWDQAMEAANSRYVHMASESSKQLKASLSTSLKESAEIHSHMLVEAEEHFLKHTGENILKIVNAIDGKAGKMNELQEKITQQAEMLQQVITATHQVATLEERLNQNLNALAGARHFEETVNSLGAVIHLLNAKLTALHGVAPVQLPHQTRGKGKGTAA